MNGTFPWYVARSAGLVAWALLSASVLWGLLMSTHSRPFGHRPRPAWMLDLHRWLGALATIFVAVHVLAILVDTYVDFSIASVLVPFAASWRTTAVAWGVVAMWLLVAVELTSLARAHLPRRAWRVVHTASFPLFALATLHAFTAGTDTGSLVFIGLAVPVIMVIGGLTGMRVAEATHPTPPAVAPTGRPGDHTPWMRPTPPGA